MLVRISPGINPEIEVKECAACFLAAPHVWEGEPRSTRCKKLSGLRRLYSVCVIFLCKIKYLRILIFNRTPSQGVNTQ